MCTRSQIIHKALKNERNKNDSYSKPEKDDNGAVQGADSKGTRAPWGAYCSRTGMGYSKSSLYAKS
jgi:hypothetical protein